MYQINDHWWLWRDRPNVIHYASTSAVLGVNVSSYIVKYGVDSGTKADHPGSPPVYVADMTTHSLSLVWVVVDRSVDPADERWHSNVDSGFVPVSALSTSSPTDHTVHYPAFTIMARERTTGITLHNTQVSHTRGHRFKNVFQFFYLCDVFTSVQHSKVLTLL